MIEIVVRLSLALLLSLSLALLLAWGWYSSDRLALNNPSQIEASTVTVPPR